MKLESGETDEVTDIASTIYDVLLILSDDIHEYAEQIEVSDSSEINMIPEIEIVGAYQDITMDDKDFLANMVKNITKIMRDFKESPETLEIVNLVYCWNVSLGLYDLLTLPQLKQWDSCF